MAGSTDPRDDYKAILLRQSLPPSFNRTREGGFAKLMAPMGRADNRIGGLFGKSNFLGETAVGFDTVNFVPDASFSTVGPIKGLGAETWTATLIGDCDTVTYTIVDAGPSIEIRDNYYFDAQGTASWVPREGNVGILISQPGGFETLTFADLEAAILTQSKILTVMKSDSTNATAVIASTDETGKGVMTERQDRSAVDQARDSMFVNTASGKALTDLGANYGVPRPPQSPFDDELYRRIIPILAWLPKTPYLVPYRLAEAIFGTQEQVALDFDNPWQFYEVNPNEIIFECPLGLIQGGVNTAGYMHGYAGNSDAITGPSATFVFTGPDARLAVANSNLSGRTIYVFHTGAWQTYTIVVASYNPGTKVNNLTLSAATLPTGNNYPFFIDVPGANSWNPGDFMLNDASIAGGGLNPPTNALVYLFGKARLDIFEFYMNNFVRAAGVSLRSEVL